MASVTTPVMALKGFERVELKPGEARHVVVALSAEELAVLNREMKWAMEPGAFTVMVGASSADIRRTARFSIAK
jgi:beta-glucosidase